MLDFREQLMTWKTENTMEEIEEKIISMNKKTINTDRVNKLISNYHNNKINDYDIINKNVVNNDYVRKEVKRGQIWYVNFGKRQGSLQSGIRPAIVESNDINNKHSNIINVSPLTSNMAKASNIPVHVPIEGFGLKESSVILIEQGTPIDVRYQLLTYIGTVDELVLQKVKKAREIQLGDLQEKSPLEKLPKHLREKIEEKLDDIYTYEKALYKAKNESLRNNLLEQREAFLCSLQKFCESHKLNYTDYYKRYDAESETVAM